VTAGLRRGSATVGRVVVVILERYVEAVLDIEAEGAVCNG
jgi:hypothetical protein